MGRVVGRTRVNERCGASSCRGGSGGLSSAQRRVVENDDQLVWDLRRRALVVRLDGRSVGGATRRSAGAAAPGRSSPTRSTLNGDQAPSARSWTAGAIVRRCRLRAPPCHQSPELLPISSSGWFLTVLRAWDHCVAGASSSGEAGSVASCWWAAGLKAATGDAPPWPRCPSCGRMSSPTSDVNSLPWASLQGQMSATGLKRWVVSHSIWLTPERQPDHKARSNQ